eukprot:CAMPEP_0204487580 /NCGR_PEP_ID=MMETSP0471-20130131/67335_1 /ASSEMBLY_ACC=CAM_ASM_000602 /TAXON_ID=2969 /ORGANISM="Oxyrrhis marina" /LENGTH=70 /DNA_ID=CAMNT_0051491277 /DNA_START=1 /DNA_END=214 /DNA_ORIENTATION=+
MAKAIAKAKSFEARQGARSPGACKQGVSYRTTERPLGAPRRPTKQLPVLNDHNSNKTADYNPDSMPLATS